MAGPGANMPQVETMPPLDARLIDRREKIKTPLDDRGLVDITKLIGVVKSTIDPSYTWPQQANTHHFYWPESYYPSSGASGMTTTYAKFRELPVHKGWMPIVFHNWLQHVTLPPPVPGPEEIAYRMESWRVAETLFKKAQTQGFRFERRLAGQRKQVIKENPELRRETAGQSKIAQRVMYSTLEQFFLEPDEPAVQRVKSLLSEICIVEPVHSAKELARGLGSVITERSIVLVPAVVEPLAA